MPSFVSEKLKTIFVDIPGTGGEPILDLFLETDTHETLQIKSHLNSDCDRYASISQLHRILDDTPDAYFSFSFYRNTFAWLYAIYSEISNSRQHHQHPMINGKDFKTYATEIAPALIGSEKGHITSDGECAVIRLEDYETFSDSIHKILYELGFPKKVISDFFAFQPPSKVDYAEQYNSTLRQQVSEIFKEDIEYFGFKF